MKSIKHAAAALCFATMAALPFTAGAKDAESPGVVEAIKIATEAYIYGYPLVTFDRVRRQQTNVVMPDAEHAPMGQLIKMRSYPVVDNHCCAAPNADTLVQVAPLREIYTEVRCWVVGGTVVTASQYKLGGRVAYASVPRDSALVAYAQARVAEWQPHRAFCLDVADTADGLAIVEINTINAAGFYAADVQKLVIALEDLEA